MTTPEAVQCPGDEEARSKRTLIGVLASKEDRRRHAELVQLLDDIVLHEEGYKATLANFVFVLTGGTYRRVLLGQGAPDGLRGVHNDTKNFLLNKCKVVRLAHAGDGGVVLLAYLVVLRKIGIVWSFLTATSSHWLQPENNALNRLCDYWHVDRLLNAPSVRDWLNRALVGQKRNACPWPLDPIEAASKPERDVGRFAFVEETSDEGDRHWRIDYRMGREDRAVRQAVSKRRIALIAHDEMKERMIDFVSDYERQLSHNFDHIVTTSTTGTRVKQAAPSLAHKIRLCHSGPKGGDIEIAAEIIFGLVDCVVFFVDPLHPHPHIDDIRVVFGACMMNPVRMLTNERQARAWMDTLDVC